MITKEHLRTKICTARGDEPLDVDEFMRWAEQRCRVEIARVLGELQMDLQEDEQIWRETGVLKEVQRTRQWREVVQSLKAYYSRQK